MARNVFMAGDDLKNTLEFLKTHKADYLFITQRSINILGNIAKEAGISHSIDIPIFGNVVQDINLVDRVTRENQTYYRYWLPGWQKYVGSYELKLGDKIYPPGTWQIVSVYIRNTETIGPIKALVELNIGGTITYILPENIYYGSKILYADKTHKYFPCTLIIDSNCEKDPRKWHIVYLSPYIRSLLTVRLFIFNELDWLFERVYPPPGTVDPFEYTAQVWKIHYPPGIKERPEYLDMGSLAPTNF